MGVKAIIDNLRVEVKELSKETDKIIKSMRNDLAQGKTIVANMLKILGNTKTIISTISTTSTMKPLTLPTIKTKEPNSSSPFLKKRIKC